PLLISNEGIGSFRKGGKDVGASRYVHFRLNKRVCDLLFPDADTHVIQYVFTEGVQCEPVMFMPILPWGLWQYYSVPATGWKSSFYPRDIKATIDAVKSLVSAIKPKPVEFDQWGIPTFRTGGLNNNVRLPVELPPSMHKFHGEMRENYYVGTFSVNGDTIHITALPPGLWNSTLLRNIRGDTEQEAKKRIAKGKEVRIGKPLVKEAEDRSGFENVDITLIMVKGWEKQLPPSSNELFSDLEYYLGIYVQMDNQLTTILPDDSVHVFKTYIDIVKKWFGPRGETYTRRFRREYALLKYRVIMLDNIIRYIALFHSELNLIRRGMTAEQADTILSSKGFIKMDIRPIKNAREVDIPTLDEQVLRGPDISYNYLTGIPVNKTHESNQRKHQEKLQKYKKRIAELEGSTVCRDAWLHEICAFEAIVDEGLRTDWFFEDFDNAKNRRVIKGGKRRVK
ncbi:hypothetical protein KDA11_06300, partial [Candidatus Saccharibacteria bacterium]|nr:hypothetical protein [Candidatus Saccharibacteria bacterium]